LSRSLSVSEEKEKTNKKRERRNEVW
jgi:hypothetical protein